MFRATVLSRCIKSQADLHRTIMYYFYHDLLHELPDDHLMSYGRSRHIQMTGSRDDMLSRLYKSILRRELQHPVKVFYYDLEFTGIPRWGDGDIPDQEVIEVGVYYPATAESFTRLIRPTNFAINDEAAALTQLDMKTLHEEGCSFKVAMQEMFDWVQKRRPHSENTQCMLLSHGGNMHDIRMIKYWCDSFDVALDSNLFFADSCKLLREATKSRSALIPNVGLATLMTQFNITPLDQHHRALSDAMATFQVLQAGCALHGNKYLTPNEQVLKKYTQWRKAEKAKPQQPVWDM
eukprot:PhM_4_TR14394/c0_g1_i1/m.10197